MHKQKNTKLKIIIDIFHAYKVFGFAGIPNDIRFFVDNIANKLKDQYDIKLDCCTNPENKRSLNYISILNGIICKTYKKLKNVYIVKYCFD